MGARKQTRRARPNAPRARRSDAADDAVTVTDENFGDLLIASLQEALAIARGELAPAREYTLERTARNTQPAVPPVFRPERVRAVRERLHVSQDVFARMLGVSTKLVQSWEQGVRGPAGAAARLLEVVEQQPDALAFTIRAAPDRAPRQAAAAPAKKAAKVPAKRVRKPGRKAPRE